MKLRNRKHFGYTTTESGTKEALTMIIPDGMARIYFYRVDDISGLSSGSDPTVFVDDVEVIKLPNRTLDELQKLKLVKLKGKEVGPSSK